MIEKRRLNEKKFPNYKQLHDGSRKYCLEIQGKHGWKARYIKELDPNEETIRFYQEIYNDKGLLVEIHEKYPEDKGHIEVKGD